MTALTPKTSPATNTALVARLDHVLAAAGARAEALGVHALRYGLVLILLWIGAMKFASPPKPRGPKHASLHRSGPRSTEPSGR